LSIASLVVLESGCSTFKSGRQKLNITTSENDANVFVNGGFVGKGNVTTDVPSNESVTVMATKEGYMPASVNIGTKLSNSGMLDLVGTFIILIPVIGLFSPGAHELQNDHVSLPLAKQSK
jgi:hypothetical protein